MIKIITENECVSCEHCINCGRKQVRYEVGICDECEDEVDTLYEDGIEQLCERCALIRWVMDSPAGTIADFVQDNDLAEAALSKYSILHL